MADAAGTTAYTYDSAGRLATLADPLTGTTATYSYNPDSLVSGISYGTGKDTRSLGYDGMRRLTTDTLKTSSGATVAAVTYGYSPDSEITSETTTGLAGATSSTYTYDEAGRLASWNNGTTTTAYGYDNNGNLTRDGAKTYTYDARDELTSDGTNSYTYAARGTPLTEPGTNGPLSVTTDAYSDLATAGTRSYTYDALGRTVTDAPATGGAYQFSYVGSTGTIASDGTSAYAWNPAGTVLDATGTPGGGTGGSLALTDTHGNQVGQFTASGTSLTGSRAYDPWGNTAATTGAMTGLLGYQSAWSDAATGKDLMGARWYNPAAGDFTSADTIQVSPDPDPAAGNPFAYAGDAPLDFIDPTGHFMSLGGALDANYTHAQQVQTASNVYYNDTAVQHYSPARAWSDANQAVRDLPISNPNISREIQQRQERMLVREQRAHRVWEHHQQYEAAKARVAAQRATEARAAAAKPKVNTIAGNDPYAASFIGVGKGLLSLNDQAWNLLTGQHSDNADAFASWSDQLLGITPGSTSVAIQNDDSTATQVGSLFVPGADEIDASRIAGDIANEAASVITETEAGDQAAAHAVDDGSSGAKADTSCPGIGGMSFTAATLVLLASGKTIPISDLKTGDKVLASDTKTGKDQPETVTAVLVHHDANLYDLTVKTSHGTQVIHTTSNHLFWDPSLNKFLPASNLKPGTRLKTPDGQAAVVVGGSVPTVHDGWMWDLTVPGNNDHDFYIAVATAAVLVHNCAAPRKGGGANDAPSWVAREAAPPQPGENAQQYATRILNDKYGDGNWPKGAGSEFSKIVKWVTRGGRFS